MSRPQSPSAVAERVEARLGRLTARRLRRGLPPPQALVLAPGVEVAAGDRHLPFHAASVGKVVTATAVMQEVERGLDLATPVAQLLPAAEIDGLFSHAGASLEHLLTHTSGVADYFDGPVVAGKTFQEEIAADPDRFWRPADTLAFSRQRQRPLFAPGDDFSYTDTGFILLGRILEERTGLDLATILRSQIFEPAGMGDTVLWLHEPGPECIAPIWLDRIEVSTLRCLSFDWAGGGLVTTLDDLAAFGTALGGGRLLRPETFAHMRTVRNRFRRGIGYGLGIMELRFDEFGPFFRGLPRPVGGIGVSSVHLFFDPAHHTTVVLNLHSTREMNAGFTTHLRIVKELARLG